MRKHTPPVPSTPFMNVRDAARATGLSEYYLRKELDKGTIPHIKSGRCIMINVPPCWCSWVCRRNKKEASA